MYNNVLDKFLSLIAHDTMSERHSDTYPSTEKQLKFANDVLVPECIKIGLEEVSADEYGYVTAALPSNIDSDLPVIGFIAHYDTSPDFSGANVKPKIIKKYQGGDIALNDGIVLSPDEFPHLNKYIGEDIITTDGTTLLGADDKAGIAEILAAMEYLIKNPQIKHGSIKIAFTPDEEVGHGVEYFNVKKFGADFAYTIDGEAVGDLEFESFNACGAEISITGKSVHPGYAKGVMVNAALIAAELAAAFPKDEIPAATEGYQGFYHLVDMSGNVSGAKLEYILRDFDKASFSARKEFVKNLVSDFNKKYGENTVSINIYDQYYNMREALESREDIKNLAVRAMTECGVTPVIRPIRGGTDGSRLSFMGLPCPNIFTGGHNFHGKYEYIPVGSMVKAVEVIIKICETIAIDDNSR